MKFTCAAFPIAAMVLASFLAPLTGPVDAAVIDLDAEGPQIVETEPFSYVCLSGRGPYSLIPEALASLRSEVAAQGIVPVGPLMTYYRDKPGLVARKNLRWDVGYPVPGEVSVRAPLTVKQFPYRKAARTLHRGSYEGTSATVAALRTWVLDEGYTTYSGPLVEFYEKTVEDGVGQALTRIVLPIKEPTIEPLQPFNYVAVVGVGPYDAVPQALELLDSEVRRTGVRPTGPPFTLYWNAPSTVAPAALRWEVGAPVREGQAAAGQLRLKRLAFAQSAQTTHHGPVTTTAETIEATRRWVAARGLKTYGGPLIEFYPDRGRVLTDELERTIISLPVRSNRPYAPSPTLDPGDD